MLFDPKWEVNTKADPLQIATLIAWLEQQPADETYCYTSNGDCLLAKYFTAQGFKNVSVSSLGYWSHGNNRKHEIPMHPSPGFHEVAVNFPRTFGGALERARKFAG